MRDNSFEYYTIAFGIRNVTNIEEALKSAYNVLKSGGKFLCLEFSQPNGEMIKKLYDFYSFNIIPKIGKIITNNEDAYIYLVESIRKFPKRRQFLSFMENAGFTQAKCTTLSSGIVSIFSGQKL
ncbi:MAG: hypothetical protein EOP34_11985 [Rickettsiales bacterium]|nr:MAG: hypothetical protein EOP34_11985 [Rickettsiales bacterium]